MYCLASRLNSAKKSSNSTLSLAYLSFKRAAIFDINSLTSDSVNGTVSLNSNGFKMTVSCIGSWGILNRQLLLFLLFFKQVLLCLCCCNLTSSNRAWSSRGRLQVICVSINLATWSAEFSLLLSYSGAFLIHSRPWMWGLPLCCISTLQKNSISEPNTPGPDVGFIKVFNKDLKRWSKYLAQVIGSSWMYLAFSWNVRSLISVVLFWISTSIRNRSSHLVSAALNVMKKVGQPSCLTMASKSLFFFSQ